MLLYLLRNLEQNLAHFAITHLPDVPTALWDMALTSDFPSLRDHRRAHVLPFVATWMYVPGTGALLPGSA